VSALPKALAERPGLGLEWPGTQPWVALGDVVQPKARTVKPEATPEATFTYVDVTAVDSTLKAITGARELKGADAPGRARRVMRAGDVLVATVRPSLNSVAMVPESLDGQVASTALCVLRATPRVLPEYIYFFVRSPWFVSRMAYMSDGGVYPAVTDTKVLKQQLPLPPLEVQRKIVEILSCAERAVNLQRRLQENSMQMGPALYNEVFGDSLANPKGWPIATLGSLLAEGPQNGLYKPKIAYGEGTPIVRINSFYEGRLRPLPELRRLRISAKDARRYGLAKDDILINRVNSPGLVGKSAIIPALAETTVFESNIMRFKVDTTQALPQYIIAALQCARTQHHFTTSERRAIGQASLNQQDVKSLTVMLPPLELQTIFSRYAEASAAGMARQARLHELAQAALDILLDRFFKPQG
jgi:type I restriction enzyme S subunit